MLMTQISYVCFGCNSQAFLCMRDVVCNYLINWESQGVDSHNCLPVMFNLNSNAAPGLMDYKKKLV